MFTKKTVLCLFVILNFLLNTININANEVEYKNQFGFVNPSYKGDLNISLRMYKTIEKHFQEKELNFYIITPSKDNEIFQNTYKEALKNKEIKKLPIFLTDEYVISKCDLGIVKPVINYTKIQDNLPFKIYITDQNINYLKSQDLQDKVSIIKDFYNKQSFDISKPNSMTFNGGWEVQQIVKLCFAKTNLLKDYIAIDSDVQAIKNFDKTLFYDKETGILKTIHNPNRSHEFYVSKNIFLNLQSSVKNKIPSFFVAEPQIFSSNMVKKMEEYTKSIYLGNIYSLIKISPFEAQWYGEYLHSFQRNKFKPSGILNIALHGSQSKRLICESVVRINNAIDKDEKIFLNIQSNIGEKTKEINSLEEFEEQYCKDRLDYKFNKIYYKIKCSLIKCEIDNVHLIFINKQFMFKIKKYLHVNLSHFIHFINKSSYEKIIAYLKPYKIKITENGDFLKKVRYGNERDGGYALYQELLDKSDVLMSYGIADDISFEEEFVLKNKKPVYAFDCGIDRLPKENNNIIFIKECLGTAKTLYGFNSKKNDKFIIKSYNQQIKDLNLQNKKIFIKMDIEGGEYESINTESFPKGLIDNITGVTLELHWLHRYKYKKKAMKLLRFLDQNFVPFHIHGNNYGWCIDSNSKVCIPSVLEITYINKNLVKQKELDKSKYPTKLDFPNNKYKEDLDLNGIINY